MKKTDMRAKFIKDKLMLKSKLITAGHALDADTISDSLLTDVLSVDKLRSSLSTN